MLTKADAAVIAIILHDERKLNTDSGIMNPATRAAIHTIDRIASKIADDFAKEMSGFDRAKFLCACGLQDGRVQQ